MLICVLIPFHVHKTAFISGTAVNTSVMLALMCFSQLI